MINESNWALPGERIFWHSQKIKLLAELIFPHVNDSRVWCRLQQVSKSFYEVSKIKLVKKDETYDKWYKYTWYELPNGQKHGQLNCFTRGKQISVQYYFNGKFYKGTMRLDGAVIFGGSVTIHPKIF